MTAADVLLLVLAFPVGWLIGTVIARLTLGD